MEASVGGGDNAVTVSSQGPGSVQVRTYGTWGAFLNQREACELGALLMALGDKG